MRVLLLQVALAVSAVLVLLLVRHNDTLRADYTELSRRANSVHEGIFLPAFQAIGTDSSLITVAAAGKPQVAYYFTTTCPYCLESLEAWKRVAAHAGTGVELVALSLDSLPATLKYIAAHDLSFSVGFFPDIRTRALYRARGVPETLLLDRDGRVVFSHRGVFDNQLADSLLQVIVVHSERRSP
jgi:peroxiredoxin